VNQSHECSAIGPGDRERAEENALTADARGTRPLEPLLLRAGEVAKLLGLGRSTVFALLAAGELPVVRIGRSVRVPRGALERWVDERTDHTKRGDVTTACVPDLRCRHSGDDSRGWPPRASSTRVR
jgi:excisionase family DNA binding protein